MGESHNINLSRWRRSAADSMQYVMDNLADVVPVCIQHCVITINDRESALLKGTSGLFPRRELFAVYYGHPSEVCSDRRTCSSISDSKSDLRITYLADNHTVHPPIHSLAHLHAHLSGTLRETIYGTPAQSGPPASS